MLRAALTQTANVHPLPPRPEEADMEAVRRANVAHHVGLMRAAKAQGVQLVGFGELFTGPYFALDEHPAWRELAEPLDGPTVSELSAAARELEMVVVAPIYERDGDRRFNTAVFIDADGAVLGHYSKVHIPQGSNEQGTFRERFYYERSAGRPNPRSLSDNPYFPVFQTAVGRIGAAICYDRHFEGVMSSLARGGAQVVLSPAVTFGAKSEAMWAHEFLVDAMRHRLFIGGSNRLGVEAPWKQPYFGKSHWTGPDGPLANRSEHPELIVADLELGLLEGGDSSGWTLLADRRPDIYTRG